MYHRGDVEAFYREPSYLWSGWEFSIRANEHSFTFDDILTVRAVTRWQRSTLFIGPLGTAAFRSKYGEWVRRLRDELTEHAREAERQRTESQNLAAHFHRQSEALAAETSALRHEKQVLESRIQAMQASRFWKMRNEWFRIKRAMHLTDET
jgi:hypothetical protein